MNLPGKLLAIHAALDAAGLAHAFGGAIALAYWTLDPRGTSDIDVNIFHPAERAGEALPGLPDGVAYDETDRRRLEVDGQARLWWERTPVDLFFSYEPLHDEALRNRRLVPFSGERIPILGPVELGVFKAVFDRTRDWADIEAMLVAETLDLEAVRQHLVELLGSDDERLSRLAAAERRADSER